MQAAEAGNYIFAPLEIAIISRTTDLRRFAQVGVSAGGGVENESNLLICFKILLQENETYVCQATPPKGIALEFAILLGLLFSNKAGLRA